MDLLGYIWEKSRDARYSYREGTFKNERRHAPTVLLGWVSASLKFMKIFVIRHGETDSNQNGFVMGNRVDESLNETGIKQAETIVTDLVGEKFDVIFSSTLKRALETAQIINKQLNLQVVVDKRIVERDFGSLTGKSWNQIEKEFRSTAHTEDRAQKYDYTSFGGETAEDVKQRLLSFLDLVKKEYGSKKVLIIAHGGIMKMLQHLYTEGEIFTPENGSLHSFDI